MHKPLLILQPFHATSAEILRKFSNGQSLTSEERTVLERYHRQFAGEEYDPVLAYFLESHAQRDKRYQATFLLPHEMMNAEDIKKLKDRIKLFLQEKKQRIAVPMKEKQFVAFKALTAQELIFWHGNQFLTGAPMFPGGIAPVLFMQWGNFFGIVKYVFMPEEKALKANILMYFEEMMDRNLDQCVNDYNLTLQKEIKLQDELVLEHRIEEPAYEHLLIKAPGLIRY